jgi:hypothetical protein
MNSPPIFYGSYIAKPPNAERYAESESFESGVRIWLLRDNPGVARLAMSG